MNKGRIGSFVCGSLLALAGGIAVAQQRLDSDAPGVIPRVRVDTTLLNDVAEGQFLQSQPSVADRWIGVGVAPVPDLLRAHVSLPDAGGVLVEQVVPDSPAAQAGLQRHDILTEADGKLLTDARSLVDAVRAAQDGSLELKWMRGGRQLVAKVTPAERPQTLQLGREQPWPGGPTVDPQDLGRLRDWIDRLEKNRGDQGPMSLRFFGPHDGQVFQNNINVQIQRQGDEPAKIKVEKDGNSWEVTENDLDQLPPDVRAHVQSMLGGRMQFNLPNLQGALPQGTPRLEQIFPDGFSFPEFETQLEEMNQRMEKMFEELHQMRTEQQPAPVPVPAPEDLEGGDEA
jgi:hypothetical protein